jgi:putative FmdB family regulatory protein
MPTYEYRCKDCTHRFDIFQAFSDDSLTECPACNGTLKKVFGNVGITFKGSGFYKTDSRSAALAGSNGDTGKGDGRSDKADSASTGNGSSESNSKSESNGASKTASGSTDGGSKDSSGSGGSGRTKASADTKG